MHTRSSLTTLTLTVINPNSIVDLSYVECAGGGGTVGKISYCKPGYHVYRNATRSSQAHEIENYQGDHGEQQVTNLINPKEVLN